MKAEGIFFAPAKDWWRPAAGLAWQWQLTGKLNFDLRTNVIDIDLDVDQTAADYYHSKGINLKIGLASTLTG